jgi:hypothetical protein
MCTSSLIDYATAPTQTTSACCILSPIGCTTDVPVQLQPKRFTLLNGTLSVNVPFETSLVPSLPRLTSRALVAVSLKEKDVAPMGCHDYTACVMKRMVSSVKTVGVLFVRRALYLLTIDIDPMVPVERLPQLRWRRVCDQPNVSFAFRPQLHSRVVMDTFSCSALLTRTALVGWTDQACLRR